MVWAALVQANVLLFRPGSGDHPAEVVYGPDPKAFDDCPDSLSGIARSLFSLKGTEQYDPELQVFSDHLADEMERTMRMPVPRKLAGNETVHITCVIVARRHLPEQVLHGSIFPLLIHPEKTDVTMILPSRYWPEDLPEAVQKPF
ncbi:hypothetical protein OG349_11655 [Streptomyces sp. NBC_01317]|uniref:hypothetical protein n=1 Tax=Streptomyces sp. NBC_01317 TaxID=2903822 RepID=UPI002E0FE4F5|nr:hypothetical protein OG349_11655 [Streptomyces sp. NBC_01317]